MTISLKAFVENMRQRENVETAKTLASAMIEDIHELCMASERKSIIIDKIGEALVGALLPKYTKEINKSFVVHPQKNEEGENVE